jgi:hypothetical protein
VSKRSAGVCPSCGWERTSGALFCRRCGFELGAPQTPVARSSRGRRLLVAVGIAALIGLAAGVVAVIVIHGDNQKTAENGARTDLPDPVQAIRHHFKLLMEGSYLAASNDLTPALLDSEGGRFRWLLGQQFDPLLSAELKATVNRESDTDAIVSVRRLRTVGAGSGCKLFSGIYRLVLSRKRWKIDRADLTARVCGGANSLPPILGGV